MIRVEGDIITKDEREQVLHKIKGEIGVLGEIVVAILYDSEKLLTLEEIEEVLKEEQELVYDSKEIRQVLYKLQDEGYARSRKYRNDETGWISFLWNLFPDKILR